MKRDFGPDEIQFLFSRSSGPGGQNVNKVNTRVTLLFDLSKTERFTQTEKAKIRRSLKRYLDKNGCVHIHCQEYRTQSANRKAALERLLALLEKALRPRKVRRKTRIPRGAVEKRLRNKKRRSEIKQQRTEPPAGQ